MITDKCKCGAAVTISHRHQTDEARSHDRWLDAHAVCRETFELTVGDVGGSARVDTPPEPPTNRDVNTHDTRRTT